MRILSNAQYDELLRRVHKAESERDLYQERARDADARYTLLIDRTLQGQSPVIAPSEIPPAQPPAPFLPPEIHAALEDFMSDQDLYSHNLRWAQRELAMGSPVEDVVKTIRYGELTSDMAVLS